MAPAVFRFKDGQLGLRTENLISHSLECKMDLYAYEICQQIYGWISSVNFSRGKKEKRSNIFSKTGLPLVIQVVLLLEKLKRGTPWEDLSLSLMEIWEAKVSADHWRERRHSLIFLPMKQLQGPFTPPISTHDFFFYSSDFSLNKFPEHFFSIRLNEN